jgi:PhoPQ-activated pathogenicity-related protein
MVINMLNMAPHSRLQREAFGGQPSEQIDDYRGLDEFIDTPRGQTLRSIVDPWEYRSQLTLPKLIILGTNDRYWPLDACDLYWNDLQGEKYLIYIPNNGHGLPDRARIIAGLNALNQRVMTGKPLPKVNWTFVPTEKGVKLTITSDTPASRMQIWTASAAARDFRDSKWTTLGSDVGGESFGALLPQPTTGNAAYFGELTFGGGTDAEFSLSTSIRIVPSTSAAAVGK